MTQNYETKRVQTIVLIALYTALVATITLFTEVPFGPGGYFNLGDVGVMILAAITPVRHALFAASMGSALADLLAGYPHYAVFTAIIKGSMVVAIYLLRRVFKKKWSFVPFIAGSLIMITLYGLTDAFLLGDYTSFWASASTNLVQAIMGCVITIALYPLTTKLQEFLKG